MWRRWVAFCLVLGLSLAPCLASSPPESPSSPSSGSVVLSAEEYASVEAAILQAQEALKTSNEKIQAQSKALTMLWIFSGVLVLAVTIRATADLITAIKK